MSSRGLNIIPKNQPITLRATRPRLPTCLGSEGALPSRSDLSSQSRSIGATVFDE